MMTDLDWDISNLHDSVFGLTPSPPKKEKEKGKILDSIGFSNIVERQSSTPTMGKYSQWDTIPSEYEIGEFNVN